MIFRVLLWMILLWKLVHYVKYFRISSHENKKSLKHIFYQKYFLWWNGLQAFLFLYDNMKFFFSAFCTAFNLNMEIYKVNTSIKTDG